MVRICQQTHRVDTVTANKCRESRGGKNDKIISSQRKCSAEIVYEQKVASSWLTASDSAGDDRLSLPETNTKIRLCQMIFHQSRDGLSYEKSSFGL